MKLPLSVLIVDDEALDRELLHNLIRDYCTSLQVIGQASNAADAIKLLNTAKPNVLFLDINMPNTNGFAMLEQLKADRDFLVIFTTGYDAYGIKAVKAGAFDYLLKPIDLDELQACEKRILQTLHKSNLANKTVSFFHNGQHQVVEADEIIYLEAQGSYTSIDLRSGKQMLVTKNLSTVLEEINMPNFVRVHRSYVINLKHIQAYQWTGNEGFVSLKNKKQIKVGRKFKANLKQML